MDFYDDYPDTFIDDTLGGDQGVQYNVYPDTEIKKQMKSVVDEVSNIFCLSSEVAIKLLRYFCFDSTKLSENWIEQQDSISESLGLKYAQIDIKPRCGICFEDYPVDSLYVSPCGHSYCIDCWTKTLISWVKDKGLDCLNAHCPECQCCVFDEVFYRFLKNYHLEYEMYDHLVSRSFVELSKERIYCINKDCNCFISCNLRNGAIVECKCGIKICFNCKEEPHAPCTCEQVIKWKTTSEIDGELASWIVNNTKPCPKCHQNIEKNAGCMHMTCRFPGCKYEFCWLCLGDWKTHNLTLGYWKCNVYSSSLKDGKIAEINQKIENLRSDRSIFYLSRFRNHEESIGVARALIPNVKSKIEYLTSNYLMMNQEVDFLSQTCEQIIKNRGVLKWSYVYAYYAFENEDRDNSKRLFELRQSLLEMITEGLQELIQIKFAKLFVEAFNREKFNEYKADVVTHLLSSSTYLSNFVEAVDSES